MNSTEVKAKVSGPYSSAKEITDSRKARRTRPQEDKAGDNSSREAERPVVAAYDKVRTKWSKGAPRKMRSTQNPPNRQQW